MLNYNLCADVSIFAGGPEKNLKKTYFFFVFGNDQLLSQLT